MLNPRERIDRLFDPGSFIESGLFAVSARVEDKQSTPADAKVAGFGRINRREVAAMSNDFTVKGASSANTNIKKLKHIKGVAKKRGIPVVFLGESTGARPRADCALTSVCRVTAVVNRRSAQPAQLIKF